MPLPRPFPRRRRSGRRLDYECAVLQALLASIDVPMVAWARDGRITHATHPAGELIEDACPADPTLDAWIRMLRPRTHSGVPMAIEDLPPIRAFQGEVLSDVDVLVHLRGRDVLFSTAARPIEDLKGRRHGAAVLLRDVTERRRREALLRSRLSEDAS